MNSLGKELTCPLCRGEWGEFKWRPPPPKRRTREERKDVHYGTHCGACKRVGWGALRMGGQALASAGSS